MITARELKDSLKALPQYYREIIICVMDGESPGVLIDSDDADPPPFELIPAQYRDHVKRYYYGGCAFKMHDKDFGGEQACKRWLARLSPEERTMVTDIWLDINWGREPWSLWNAQDSEAERQAAIRRVADLRPRLGNDMAGQPMTLEPGVLKSNFPRLETDSNGVETIVEYWMGEGDRWSSAHRPEDSNRPW